VFGLLVVLRCCPERAAGGVRGAKGGGGARGERSQR
jgi:hypothetical protein